MINVLIINCGLNPTGTCIPLSLTLTGLPLITKQAGSALLWTDAEIDFHVHPDTYRKKTTVICFQFIYHNHIAIGLYKIQEYRRIKQAVFHTPDSLALVKKYQDKVDYTVSQTKKRNIADFEGF